MSSKIDEQDDDSRGFDNNAEWKAREEFIAEMDRATASTETSERCVECGHSDGVDEQGVCGSQEYDHTNNTSCICHGCICKCVFPSPPSPAPEQGRGKK